MERGLVSRTTLIGITSPLLAETRPSGFLVIASPQPSLVGSFFELAAQQTIIGRDPAAEVQIPDDGISRSHVRIERREGNEYFAVDLSSTNGTWLNGVRVRSAVLVDGDLLEIGTGTKLRFGPRIESTDHLIVSATPIPPGTGAFEYDAASRRLSIIGSIAPFMGLESGSSPKSDGALGRVYEEDRPGLRAGLEAALEAGACELEFRVVGPHDETAWVAMRGQTWRDRSGAALRVAGTVTAITERNRAEFELRRQPFFFDSQTDAIAVLGLEGKIRDWNPAAERLFGWSKAEALGQTPELLLHPEPEHQLGGSGIASGERFEATFALTRKSGKPIQIEALGVPLRDPDGATRHRVLLLRDEGQRRRAMAQMQMTERLASIGTLAAGVAHEVNNPLSFIGSNLAFVREQLGQAATALGPLHAQIDDSLADCLEGLERIRVIVKDLKSFSRATPDESVSTDVDVNKAVHFALRVGEGEVRRHAQVVTDLAPLPPVIASEARLGQIFMNLVLNAAQAIPEGKPRENEIRICSRFDAATGQVTVEVSDTGSGIKPENLRRIFEPFYTTKPPGLGTGLGLFVCQGIVHSLGGEISVRSTVGQGTTFTVCLPAANSNGHRT